MRTVLRLAIIFITSGGLSLLSHATPCKKCGAETPQCHCAHTRPIPDRELCSYHERYVTQSLDSEESDHSDSDIVNRTTPVVGTIVLVPRDEAEGIALNTDGTPSEGPDYSTYGCHFNKAKTQTKAFTGQGHSLQGTSTRTDHENPPATDITGVINRLTNLQLTNTGENELFELVESALRSAVASAQTLITESDYEPEMARRVALCASLLSINYESSTMDVEAPGNIFRTIRRLLADGDIVYLVNGNDHSVFFPEASGRFYTVSHITHSSTDIEHENTRRRGISQQLSGAQLSTPPRLLKLYTLRKKQPDTHLQSM